MRYLELKCYSNHGGFGKGRKDMVFNGFIDHVMDYLKSSIIICLKKQFGYIGETQITSTKCFQLNSICSRF